MFQKKDTSTEIDITNLSIQEFLQYQMKIKFSCSISIRVSNNNYELILNIRQIVNKI